MADRTSSLPPRPDSSPARSWWGWGALDQALSDAECASLAALVPGAAGTPLPVPSIASLDLPRVRVGAPAPLAHLLSSAPADRASHTYGKAFRDVVRALYGDMAAAPDLVGFPRDERDVVDLLDWAAGADVAVVPYGAGSSVVGGVEYRAGVHSGVLSLDLSGLDRVLETDRVSRAARIQAGALGPGLESQLRPHGLTLRHFPQSFAFSTLGGWLATRAGGHYATLHTHIDDLVESLRVVTPSGVSQSLRVPGSGRGPPRPVVPRFGGHPRDHHGGVDAAPGPPRAQGVGVGGVRALPRRGGGRPHHRAVGSAPGQLPSARPG
ncbi:hypothetical protein Smic_80440 [Streptomyces microflavus]|uniref:FAD-binding PCMH-type domain-containing protein n=1 Tax=Streptomyces microflavus TaxID=1919 RepID=A0A7J0D458_STRMI|nr:hypothetical protein Smic_80440 [Streptomyces microflavus]